MKTGDDMLDEDVPGNSGNSAPSRDDHVKAWQSSISQILSSFNTQAVAKALAKGKNRERPKEEVKEEERPGSELFCWIVDVFFASCLLNEESATARGREDRRGDVNARRLRLSWRLPCQLRVVRAERISAAFVGRAAMHDTSRC